VVLGVQKQPGVDTVLLTREIEAARSNPRRNPCRPDITTLKVQFRQASFIETRSATWNAY
jgi:hypothetical protein